VINGIMLGSMYGIAAAAANIPFVIKFEDDAWNRATARVFVGNAAQTDTEGTPTLSFTGLVSDISVVSVTASFSHANWATGTSSAQLSGFFSADTWTPAVVPEPSTIAVIFAAGLLMSVDANNLSGKIVGYQPALAIPWGIVGTGVLIVMAVATGASLAPAVGAARQEPLALLQAGRAAA
jgi:hypothetical protein